MRGDSVLLGLCGGGGNDTLAFVVVLVVGVLYGLAVGAALTRAEDGTELAALIILFMVAAAVGGLFFLYPHGIEGNGDYLGRFVISLLASGILGTGVVLKLGEQSAARVLFIALAGDVLVPGGLFLLFFTAFGIGTGCLA